ncbi:MAG TPA: winged helix-turn-helix domain-containing protein [Terriglobales bacterium]|nr:winged helix-turn-helix domain-containing protein [Terriglobales bacterium]
MPARTVRFGPFQLDLRAAELQQNGRKIKLPEQPFQILCELVEHPGEVVTREELRQRLWRSDTFVDFEHGLNTAVKRLREALGDSAENPRYIETLPRRGYRLIAPLEKSVLTAHTLSNDSLRRRKIRLAVTVLLLVTVPAGVIWWLREGLHPVKIESLAVLPLESLSGNPEEGRLADDTTGFLVTELEKFRELRVASLQSVMSFKGTNRPLRQIAAELDVDAVLEGSVVRTGDKVRITVQLVQARPERYLWSESYERDLRDVGPLRNQVVHALVAKIGTGGRFWWSRARTPTKPPSALSIQRLTTSGILELAAISPGGKYLVYTENDGHKQSLWLQQMASGSRTALLPPAAAEYGAVKFSPDSNYIYYTRKNGKGSTDLYQIAALGGAPRKQLGDVPKEFAVSPDGRSFAYVRSGWPEKETALLVGTADGAPEKTIATWPKSAHLREWMAWSPDGKLVATVHVSPTSMSLVVVPIDGAPQAEIFRSETWRDIYTPVWLPDGSGLIAPAYEKAPQLWEFPYPAGPPRQITQFTTRYYTASLTADSRALVAVEETNLSGIWVGPATEPDRVRRVTPPGSRTVGAIGLAWTPDGRMIYWSNDRDQSDFMMMNVDGSNAQRLPLDGLKWFPNVCPDGHTLLFMAPDPVTAEDVVMRADLDGGQPQTIRGTNAWGFIHCTPDGKWVVYNRGTSMKLFKVPIEGGAQVELTDRTCIPSALSPDGRWIACHYLPEQGGPKLAIIPFGGGPPVKVFDLPSTVVCLRQRGESNKGFLTPFAWTPDGRAVAFVDDRDGVGNLWAQPIAGGAPVKLTHFTAEGISFFAWSRDGKQIALARGTDTDDAVLITNFR